MNGSWEWLRNDNGDFMDLYKLEGDKLKFLKPKELAGPKGEETLQKLIEKNLTYIFNLKFIDSQVVVQGKRFDTLAYDEENNRVIVIEYKKGTDSGIVDQGITYLTLVHENKDLIKYKIKEKLEKQKVDIDWSSTKVIFIAKNFDNYQTYVSSIRSAPFELWTYELYDGFLALEKIEQPATKTSFNTLISSKQEFKKISQDFITYDLDYHLNKMKPELRDVFKLYREKIKSFGPDIEEVIDQKSGITYRHNKISFIRFEFRVNQFNALFKEKEGYVDPKNLSRDIREYKWGFERQVVITSKDNFDDVIYLLKQAYDTTI